MVYITKGLSESCWGVVLREVRLETERVITVELPRASPGRRQALWQPDTAGWPGQRCWLRRKCSEETAGADRGPSQRPRI